VENLLQDKTRPAGAPKPAGMHLPLDVVRGEDLRVGRKPGHTADCPLGVIRSAGSPGRPQPAACLILGHEHRLAGRVPRLPRQASPRCPRRPRAPGGGGALQGVQAQEVGHRHHDCGLAAQVDHLIRSGIRPGRGWLGGHRLPPLIMRSRSSTAGTLSLTFANVQSSSRAIVSPAQARSRLCIACS
jgi:hypothetical protein